MKKTILSLGLLLAVSVASAQSYIKQPDPTTYNVVEYKATKKATPALEKEGIEAATATAAAPKEERTRVDEFDTKARVKDESKSAITNNKNKVATKDK